MATRDESTIETAQIKNASDFKWAGVLFLIAGIEGLLLNTIAESVYPNYSVSKQPLSDLGATTASTFLFWDASLFLLGVLVLLGAYLYHTRSGRRVVFTCYVIAGIGPIVVAIAPENVNLTVHGVGALAAFIFGGVSAVLTYRFTGSPFRYFSLALGVLSLVSVILLFSMNDLGLGFGGMERMIAYPWDLWLLGLGAYLLGRFESRSS